MNRSKYQNLFNDKRPRLFTIPEAMSEYRLSRSKLLEIAENENAVRRFGRSVRIDVPVMDKAITNY